MNELSMTEQETIIGLLRLGWSRRKVERETGHRRETIANIGRQVGLLPPKPATPAKVPTDLGVAIGEPKPAPVAFANLSRRDRGRSGQRLQR